MCILSTVTIANEDHPLQYSTTCDIECTYVDSGGHDYDIEDMFSEAQQYFICQPKSSQVDFVHIINYRIGIHMMME